MLKEESNMKELPSYGALVYPDDSVNNLSLSKKDVKKINELYCEIVNKNIFMQNSVENPSEYKQHVNVAVPSYNTNSIRVTSNKPPLGKPANQKTRLR